MAGASSDFDADEFRTNIRATMLMGLPQDPAKRPRFLFPTALTYDNSDQGGAPFDWTATPEGDAPRTPVLCGNATGQVVCVWEDEGTKRRPSETTIGHFDPDRLQFTMLDIDFVLVDGFDRIELGDTVYLYEKSEPERGLHDVTIHQISVIAQDAA